MTVTDPVRWTEGPLACRHGGVFQLLKTVQLRLCRTWMSEDLDVVTTTMKTTLTLSSQRPERASFHLLSYFLVMSSVFVATCPPSDPLSDTNSSSKHVVF